MKALLYMFAAMLGIAWILGFETSIGNSPLEPPDNPGHYVGLVVASLFVAAPWMVATVAAVAVAGLTVSETLRLFAMTFLGLLGMLVVLSLARSRLNRPFRTLSVAGFAGVAACVAVLVNFLRQFPSGALHLGPGAAVFLAVLLAGGLWLTLGMPAGHVASIAGVGVAVLLGGGLLLVSQWGLRDIGGWGGGVFGYLFLAPLVGLFVISTVTAWAAKSFHTGIQVTISAAVLSSLAFFAIGVSESVLWYQADTSLILAGDGVPLHAVGENIRNFMWGLILYPLWWAPFGIMGAALGGRNSPGRPGHLPKTLS